MGNQLLVIISLNIDRILPPMAVPESQVAYLLPEIATVACGRIPQMVTQRGTFYNIGISMNFKTKLTNVMVQH